MSIPAIETTPSAVEQPTGGQVKTDLVLMVDGEYRAIGDIELGDWVLSPILNPLRPITICRVISSQVMAISTSKQYTYAILEASTEEVIYSCTHDHLVRYLIDDDGYLDTPTSIYYYKEEEVRPIRRVLTFYNTSIPFMVVKCGFFEVSAIKLSAPSGAYITNNVVTVGG